MYSFGTIVIFFDSLCRRSATTVMLSLRDLLLCRRSAAYRYAVALRLWFIVIGCLAVSIGVVVWNLPRSGNKI